MTKGSTTSLFLCLGQEDRYFHAKCEKAVETKDEMNVS